MKLYALGMVFVLVFAAPILHGQTQPPANTTPLCKPAGIDATFSFTDAPTGEQTIGIHLHNVTLQSCRLQGELAPDFVAGSQSTGVMTCWLCTPDGRPDAAAIQRNNDFILSGNGDAQVMYQWSEIGHNCPKIDWATISVEWDGRANFLFSNRHWKPLICSTVQISGYEPDEKAAMRRTSSQQAVLEIGPPPGPIYADELIQLKLELKSKDGGIKPFDRCPELYAVYKNLHSTRFEAILPDGFSYLVRNADDQPSLSVSSPFDDLPAQFSGYVRLCDTGSHHKTTVTLPASLSAPINSVPQPNLDSLRHIVWRAEDSSTHEAVFVTADTRFNILDPDTLPQNWGPQVDGIGAGLSVDKTTFSFGEEIPLHIRWENFGASKELAVGECGDPQPQVEVQDASHQVLGMLRTDHLELCFGHGWGPSSIEHGKPHRNFASLRHVAMGYTTTGEEVPITQPGVYYLSAVWAPPTLVQKADKNRSELAPGAEPEIVPALVYALGEPYATARSLPIRIEILPVKN